MRRDVTESYSLVKLGLISSNFDISDLENENFGPRKVCPFLKYEISLQDLVPDLDSALITFSKFILFYEFFLTTSIL